MSIKVLCLPVA